MTRKKSRKSGVNCSFKCDQSKPFDGNSSLIKENEQSEYHFEYKSNPNALFGGKKQDQEQKKTLLKY
jgi:hypothetical protein